MKKTFEQWMAEVNQQIENMYGLSSDDLPDCCYRDWYDDGLSTKSAARRAIKNAGE